jgi:magnesium chelatase subunit D
MIGQPGRADPPPDPPPAPAPAAARNPTPAETRRRVDDAGRRTLSRDELTASHAGFGAVSPQVGRLDAAVLSAQLRRDPEPTVALLADLAVATDPALRADARRLARRLLPPLGRVGVPQKRGTRRMVVHRGSLAGDLDLDRTLEHSDGRRPQRAETIVSRAWGAAPRAVCLLVDRSGSMTGRAVALAAVAAAAVVEAASDRLRTGVIAFAAEPLVLGDLRSEIAADRVVDDLLALRGHGVTDLARALRAAAAQLEPITPPGRTAILMSDCLATRGADPLGPAGAFDTLHVLVTSDDPEAVSAAAALARRGRGRCLPATELIQLSTNLHILMH